MKPGTILPCPRCGGEMVSARISHENGPPTYLIGYLTCRSCRLQQAIVAG